MIDWLCAFKPMDIFMLFFSISFFSILWPLTKTMSKLSGNDEYAELNKRWREKNAAERYRENEGQ